jgi:hypothetical protein
MQLKEAGRTSNLRLRGGVPLAMIAPKIIICGVFSCVCAYFCVCWKFPDMHEHSHQHF